MNTSLIFVRFFRFFIFAKRGVWGDRNFLVKNHESQIDVFSLKLKKMAPVDILSPLLLSFIFLLHMY